MSAHETHCCPVHGCKYAFGKADEEACPIVSGVTKPRYPHNNGCEFCDETAQTADDIFAHFGIRTVWNVGFKRPDGTVFATGMASYSRKEVAEDRVAVYNAERAETVEGPPPYVLVKQYISDWMEA